MDGREDTGSLHHDLTSGGGGTLSSGKRRLIRGGFAARISSKVRPQDTGGEAARIAVPREVVDISVVLVEEAEVRSVEGLASAPVDKDLRLLASAMCPASVTVCVISPGVVGMLSPSGFDSVGPVGPDGMLSSSDLAGILFPAVPAGIPFPVGPVGPYGTLSPSDSVGPVGPYGTLSPSD